MAPKRQMRRDEEKLASINSTGVCIERSPDTVRELLTKVLKDVKGGIFKSSGKPNISRAIQILGNWWEDKQKSQRGKKHVTNLDIKPMQETTLRKFMKGNVVAREHHLKFLQVFLDDVVTPTLDKSRINNPYSLQRKEVYRKRFMNGKTKGTNNVKKKQQSKHRRKEINSKSYKTCKGRKKHKMINFGMKTVLQEARDVTKHFNAGTTDYLRNQGLENGEASNGVKYEVYTCSRDDSRDIDWSRHWRCDWKGDRCVSVDTCPLISKGPFDIGTLDYFYCTTAKEYIDDYYSKSFIVNMIPFCFYHLKLKRMIVPNYTFTGTHIPTDVNYTIQKFMDSFEAVTRRNNQKRNNVQIIDTDRNISKSAFSSLLCVDAGPDTAWGFQLKRITAQENPLFVATGSHNVHLKLKHRKQNVRANDNMMDEDKHIFDQDHPFVEITFQPMSQQTEISTE